MALEKYYCQKAGDAISGHFANVYDMVSQLKPLVENSDATYFFRGQYRPWKLKASIHRSNNIIENITKTYDFINWLKENEYICNKNEPVNDNMLMAVAQHYQYQTDFIDFTTDLEVAAFFATDFKSRKDLADDTQGCLWCISSDEIKILQKIFWYEVEKGSITDQTVIKEFKENPISPFFKYDFPGLSRIKNQAGLFLWDYQGLFTAKYFGSADCTFEHTKPGAFSTDRVNKGFIYPTPNSLEREIERYIYPRTIKTTTQSEAYKELIKKVKVFDMEPVAKRSNFEEKLQEIAWHDEEWKKHNKTFFPNSTTYNYKSKILTLNYVYSINQENCMDLVSQFCTEFENGYILKYRCADETFEKTINEILTTLFLYPYNNLQISECLFYSIQYIKCALAAFKAETGLPWSTTMPKIPFPAITNYISMYKVAEMVYDSEVFQMGMQDTMHVSTYCFADYAFFDDMRKEYKKEQIKKAKEYANINKLSLIEPINGVVLMQLTTTPRKLFDFEDICKLFTKYVLPYQFVFRKSEGRIYIPCFLDSIGLA